MTLNKLFNMIQLTKDVVWDVVALGVSADGE